MPKMTATQLGMNLVIIFHKLIFLSIKYPKTVKKKVHPSFSESNMTSFNAVFWYEQQPKTQRHSVDRKPANNHYGEAGTREF